MATPKLAEGQTPEPQPPKPEPPPQPGEPQPDVPQPHPPRPERPVPPEPIQISPTLKMMRVSLGAVRSRKVTRRSSGVDDCIGGQRAALGLNEWQERRIIQAAKLAAQHSRERYVMVRADRAAVSWDEQRTLGDSPPRRRGGDQAPGAQRSS